MKRLYIILMLVLMFSVMGFTPNSTRTATYAQRSAPAILAAPVRVSPSDNSQVAGDITFVWNPVPGASRYHLQAALNPYFDQQYNIIDRGSLTEPSYTFHVTPGFVVYFPHLYWRVQAIDANGVPGAWSTTGYFTLHR